MPAERSIYMETAAGYMTHKGHTIQADNFKNIKDIKNTQ